MTRLELDPFLELARHSAVTVRVGSDAPPCAFLFRRGVL
jgi:L-fucose mutarotase